MRYSFVHFNSFSALQACDVKQGWKAFNGSCYKHFTEFLFQPDAQTRCELINGSLVILNSMEEFQFLFTSLLPETYQVWIGLYDFNPNGPRMWKWLDGSVPLFNKWGAGQPSHWTSRCVTAFKGSYNSKQWYNVGNDRKCSKYPMELSCETKQNQPH